MMLKKYLNSEQGMGFVDLLAATIVSIIALSSMFLIILSSQIRVTQNYHYRKALLGALSRLETIKYYNRNFNGGLIVNIPGIEENITLDENYSPRLVGTVTVSVNEKTGLLEVAPFTGRFEVSVKVEWKERSSSILRLFHPKVQQVLLREDYYYRRHQESS